MKSSKLLTKLAACLLVLVLIAACGSGGGSTAGDTAPSGGDSGETPSAAAEPSAEAEAPYELTVGWWGGVARHEKTLEMIDLYTERFPQATVIPNYAAFDDYWVQMSTLAAANNMPDAMLVQLTYLGEYAQRGLIRNLQPLVDAGHIDVSSFTAGALSGSTIQGNLVGITMGDTSSATVYNKSLLERLGVTEMPSDQMLMSEFADYLKALVPLMPDGHYVAELFARGEQNMEIFMRQHGFYGLTTEDGTEVGFSREALADFFNYHLDLYNAGVYGPIEIILDDRNAQFGDSLRGRGLQAFWGTNVNQAKIFQSTLEDELGMLRSQVADGYTNRNVEVAVCSTWTIASNSNLETEAARFISYMVNEWDLQSIYDMDIGVPGSTVIQQHLLDRLDVSDPVDAMKAREIELMQDILGSIEPFNGRPAGYPVVVDDLRRLMDEILAGNISVDAAVDSHFNSMSMLLD